MNIWEFTDYREYLTEKIGPTGTRSGLRKKLAESVGIHTTYVSQVLKGTAHFSPEQAEAINEFFGHLDDEGEYFLLLVMLGRAGSSKLQDRLRKRLEKLRKNQVNIAKRIQAQSGISDQDKTKFYSSALYGIIHVLTSLPSIKNVEDVASALLLPKSRALEVVQFLTSVGLVSQEGGNLTPGQRHIHLANDTEWVLKHHTNWRAHTLHHLQFMSKDDVHYSSALSISKEDAFKIKELLMETLKKTVSVVRQTEVETAYALNFDFYRLLEDEKR